MAFTTPTTLSRRAVDRVERDAQLFLATVQQGTARLGVVATSRNNPLPKTPLECHPKHGFTAALVLPPIASDAI